jgi:hypothetical protein
MIAKQILDNVWIVNNGDRSMALLTLINQTYNWIDEAETVVFGDVKALEKAKGKIVWDQKTYENSKKAEIKGYPARHSDPLSFEDDELKELNFPLYTTGGNTIYVAGYWCLKTGEDHPDKKYGIMFCPKLNTLAESKYIGPFKTKLEAQQEALLQNKRNNEST